MEIKVENKTLSEKVNSLEVEKENISEKKGNENVTFGSKSLEEELSQSGYSLSVTDGFQCEDCSKMFTSRDDLKKHIQTSHVAPLNSKLLQMEKEISEQRLQIATSLFNLKQQELKEKLQPCVCRGFCSINHIKYNWTKSVSENLFSRYKSHYSCN